MHSSGLITKAATTWYLLNLAGTRAQPRLSRRQGESEPLRQRLGCHDKLEVHAAPYLASGDEMYQQMCRAYENGAKYMVIFNYSPDMKGAYGIFRINISRRSNASGPMKSTIPTLIAGMQGGYIVCFAK